MLTSKQRAYLKGLANKIETIGQIGKGGISDELVEGIGRAIDARELVKYRVLDNSEYSAKEAAMEIAEKLSAEVVQYIGGIFVLYKAKKKDPVIKFK